MSWKPRLIPGGRANAPARSEAPALSDAELVQRVLDGRPLESARSRLPGHEAFAALVDRHQARVLRLATHLLRDADAARDVAQDAFLRAFRSLPGFRQDRSFANWLLQITVNAARDHQSRLAPWLLRPLDAGAEVQAAGDLDLEVSQAVVVARIQSLLDQLSPREREVFTLRDLEGLEVDEIADVLGLEAPTVRRHLARARLRLRDLLEGPSKP